MKFTVVLVTIFSITWAVQVHHVEENKDKREVGYTSSHHYQTPGGNAISIGAGYSVGAKPSFSFSAPESTAGFHLTSESLPANGQTTIQLTPITVQATQGQVASGDLDQLMKQLSHGLNTGAISLTPYQSPDQNLHSQGRQEVSISVVKQHSTPEQTLPSYAAGTQGLGSFGSTGPVLFQPSQANQPTLTFGAPSVGHSFGGQIGSGHSLLNSGHGLGGLGQSLGGLTLGKGPLLGGSGLTLGGAGHSLGGGLQLGGLGHSYGGSIKSLGGGYVVPSKASFKPLTFLGAHGDALQGLAASYGAPSHGLSGGHGGLSLGSNNHGGLNFGNYLGGSSKHIAPGFLLPKTKGLGGTLDSIAFSSNHASPPRTTYGVPEGASSFPGGSGATSHAAASHSPQYYVSPTKFSSFGDSFKAPSGHSSVKAFSSGPKYSFGHSSRYSAPKDVHGSFSENSYNTIKYSEELKPRAH